MPKVLARFKKCTAVVAVLAATVVVSGCGDDDAEDDEAASAAPSATAPPASGTERPAGQAPATTDDGPEGGPDENMVGGEEVDIATYPWVVALRTPGRSDNFCGGALVGSGAVMTAAHCVTQRGSTTLVSPDSIEVILGRSDLNDTTSGDVVGVAQVWVAKAYNPSGLANDFAVLQLDSNVSYAPIALPAPSQTGLWRVGQDTLALGWGCESGNPPGELCTERTELSPLKAAWLDMQAPAACTEAYGSASTTALCMQSPDDSAGACQGDSGGPWAVYDSSGKPFLVGVTSFNHRDGECSPEIPQGASFVPLVTNAENWFTPGIWNVCEGTEPCPAA